MLPEGKRSSREAGGFGAKTSVKHPSNKNTVINGKSDTISNTKDALNQAGLILQYIGICYFCNSNF